MTRADLRFEKMSRRQLRAEHKALCRQIAHAIERRQYLVDQNAPDNWILRYTQEIDEMKDNLTVLGMYLDGTEVIAE